MDLTDEKKAVILNSAVTILAKMQALIEEIDIVNNEIIDRLMREVIGEAEYLKTKIYQSNKKLVGGNMVELGIHGFSV